MSPTTNLAKLLAVAIAPIVAMTALAPAAGAEPVVNEFARNVALQMGFDEGDLADLEAGTVLTRRFRKEAEKELSVTLVALLPVSADRAAAEFTAREPLDADKTILARGNLDGEVTAASFSELSLPAEELEKLAGGRVEDEFNFSKDELARLAKSVAGKSSATERESAAMQAYREILAGRVQAYQSKGLSGIASYQHGRNESHPQADLKHALPPEDGVVASETPDFQLWLSGYPQAGKVRYSQFTWLLQVLNGRPAVILAHRAESEGSEVTFLMQRDFYVGHTFDALQILAGVVPAGEGTCVLFYTNLTYTEQITGFGSRAAHGIGRKIMTGEILTLFEAVKAKL